MLEIVFLKMALACVALLSSHVCTGVSCLRCKEWETQKLHYGWQAFNSLGKALCNRSRKQMSCDLIFARAHGGNLNSTDMLRQLESVPWTASSVVVICHLFSGDIGLHEVLRSEPGPFGRDLPPGPFGCDLPQGPFWRDLPLLGR